jgi:hypothetical protein
MDDNYFKVQLHHENELTWMGQIILLNMIKSSIFPELYFFKELLPNQTSRKKLH